MAKSSYGANLDIVAPGSNIYSTSLNNKYGVGSGTSFAAPQVSGVAALILSVNPNLSPLEVRNIIECTAQKVNPEIYDYEINPKRPNGTWNREMGYGLLDAYAALLAAQETLTPKLIIRDDVYDNGTEPNPGGISLQSPDIWLTDVLGNPLTEPPHNSNCFLSVRIHNKASEASDGTDRLHLFWSRMSLGSTFPGSWYGNEYIACPNGGSELKGDRITPTEGILIPSIPAGGSRIIRVLWEIPEGSCITLPSQSVYDWKFGILAQINNIYAPVASLPGIPTGTL